MSPQDVTDIWQRLPSIAFGSELTPKFQPHHSFYSGSIPEFEAHSFKTLTHTMFLKLKSDRQLCKNGNVNSMSPGAVPLSRGLCEMQYASCYQMNLTKQSWNRITQKSLLAPQLPTKLNS